MSRNSHMNTRSLAVSLVLLAASLTASLTATLAAQSPRSAPLRPPNATHPEEFTSILSARELRDGRVLITDPGEKGLVVADFRTGKVETIGRKGSGPGEYAGVAPLYALGGDSTLMAVSFSRRWLVLDGAKIVASLGADSPALAAAGSAGVLGADAKSAVVILRTAQARPGLALPDSVYAMRMELATGVIGEATALRAIVATAMSARSTTSRPGAPPPGTVEVATRAYYTREVAAVSRDGWMAIARLDPYRVDWLAPSGTLTRGAPLPVAPERITDREKFARMKYTARTDTPKEPETAGEWPASIPPFELRLNPIILASPDGRVLILRVQSADHPEMRYDVVNRRGELERQLTLPDGHRIVAFSAKAVYVAAVDADGVQRLERHPWP